MRNPLPQPHCWSNCTTGSSREPTSTIHLQIWWATPQIVVSLFIMLRIWPLTLQRGQILRIYFTVIDNGQALHLTTCIEKQCLLNGHQVKLSTPNQTDNWHYDRWLCLWMMVKLVGQSLREHLPNCCRSITEKTWSSKLSWSSIWAGAFFKCFSYFSLFFIPSVHSHYTIVTVESSCLSVWLPLLRQSSFERDPKPCG